MTTQNNTTSAPREAGEKKWERLQSELLESKRQYLELQNIWEQVGLLVGIDVDYGYPLGLVDATKDKLNTLHTENARLRRALAKIATGNHWRGECVSIAKAAIAGRAQ